MRSRTKFPVCSWFDFKALVFKERSAPGESDTLVVRFGSRPRNRLGIIKEELNLSTFCLFMDGGNIQSVP